MKKIYSKFSRNSSRNSQQKMFITVKSDHSTMSTAVALLRSLGHDHRSTNIGSRSLDNGCRAPIVGVRSSDHDCRVTAVETPSSCHGRGKESAFNASGFPSHRRTEQAGNRRETGGKQAGNRRETGEKQLLLLIRRR